jgi:membrane protein involved in colicin uptake
VATLAAALAVWAGVHFYNNRAAEWERARAARIAELRQREDAARRDRAERDRRAEERAKAERDQRARRDAEAKRRAEEVQRARAAEDKRDQRARAAEAAAERARAAEDERARAERAQKAPAGRAAADRDQRSAAEEDRFAKKALERPPAATLAAATQIRASVSSAISTNAVGAGDTFVVTLAEDITVGGRVVARKGAAGVGAVAAANRDFVEIGLTSLTMGGRAVPISTDRVRVLAGRVIPRGTPVLFLLAAPVAVQ